MLVRTISAICALIVFLPAFIWSDSVIFVLAIAFLSALSVFELLRCTDQLKKPVISIPAVVMGLFIPFVCRFGVIFDVDYFSGRVFVTLLASSLIFFFLVIVSLIFSKDRSGMNDTISSAAICIYIVGGFSSILLLRDMKDGVYLYILPFLTSWGSDIFAYLVGRLCGKHKLAPEVSPKKTIEGSIGGVFGNIIFYVVYALIISSVANLQPNYVALVLTAVITSVIAQIGDLFMSLIKRHYGIKDFGKILPGHGGALDRFDSLIAVSPFLYLICTSNTFFVLF